MYCNSLARSSAELNDYAIHSRFYAGNEEAADPEALVDFETYVLDGLVNLYQVSALCSGHWFALGSTGLPDCY